MAMHGEYGLVGIGHTFTHGFKQSPIFVGHRIPHRVRDIDGCCTSFDGCLDTTAQEIYFRARAVFRRPFNVGDQITRPRDRLAHEIEHFFRLHLQFVFHMHGRC